MQKAIILDFDDTLVATNILFDMVKFKFKHFMQQINLDDEELLAVVNAYDVGRVRAVGGCEKECFPLSLSDGYKHYCDKYQRGPVAAELQFVEELGWSVYTITPQVFQGTVDFLTVMREKYLLILLTQGDRKIQTQRIASSGLSSFFAHQYIVHHKTAAVFENIIQKQHLDRANSWSIGNSVRSDINTALTAGLNCIHLNSCSWDFEVAVPGGNYQTVQRLSDCLRFLE